jgi:hypothetical protein
MQIRRVLALLILSVLFPICAFGDEATPPCCGEEPASEGKAQHDRTSQNQKQAGRADSPKGFPCGCPIARIEDLGGGLYLYQAERYATSCMDLPESIEMFGPYNLALSPGCDTNCTDVALKQQANPVCYPSKYFKGLPDYVEHDAENRLYPPYDGDYARLFVDPKIPYIKFKLNQEGGRDRYAKVFVYDLDVKHACNKPAASRHVIYLAKEVATPPVEGTPTPTVTPVPLQSDEVPQGEECHLFRVKCAAHRPAVQMLLLTVE